jgi:hypothetical protein
MLYSTFLFLSFCMDYGITETGIARGSPPGTTTEVLRVGFPFAEIWVISAPNRYDGWDQHVWVVSDELTVQKYERRSNRRCTSAPGWKGASDSPPACFYNASEQLRAGLRKFENFFITGWTDCLKCEGVGSSDSVKFSNRKQLSAQTPSPDDPTLEPTGHRFIRRWQFDFGWTISHFWSVECHTQANTSTSLDQSWVTTSPLKHSFIKYL